MATRWGCRAKREPGAGRTCGARRAGRLSPALGRPGVRHPRRSSRKQRPRGGLGSLQEASPGRLWGGGGAASLTSRGPPPRLRTSPFGPGAVKRGAGVQRRPFPAAGREPRCLREASGDQTRASSRRPARVDPGPLPAIPTSLPRRPHSAGAESSPPCPRPKTLSRMLTGRREAMRAFPKNVRSLNKRDHDGVMVRDTNCFPSIPKPEPGA